MAELVSNFSNTFYTPEPLHRLVLQAIVCDEEQSREAFAKWAQSVNYDLIDYKTQTLMPALYARLTQLQLQHPLLPRIKSLHAYFFTKTALLFSGIRPTLESLSAAGIDIMLLKGAGITAAFQLGPGLRPMADVDILVRHKDVDSAVSIIKSQGFCPKFDSEEERNCYTPHSYDFLNNQNMGIDLHAYSLWEYMYPGCDEELWIRADKQTFLGVDVFVLSAEDNLINICVNGVRELVKGVEHSPLNLYWIADAARLLKGEKRIDWSYVEAQAEKRGLVYHLLYAARILRCIDSGLIAQKFCDDLEKSLSFLQYSTLNQLERKMEQATLNLDLIQRKLDNISQIPSIQHLQLRQAYLKRQIENHHPGLFNLRYKWQVHTLQNFYASPATRIFTFPRFIRESWNLSHYYQMPAYMKKMLVQKIRKRGSENV